MEENNSTTGKKARGRLFISMGDSNGVTNDLEPRGYGKKINETNERNG